MGGTASRDSACFSGVSLRREGPVSAQDPAPCRRFDRFHGPKAPITSVSKVIYPY